MLLKGLFVVCIQAILIKACLSQCIRTPFIAEPICPSNMAYNGLAAVVPPVTRIVGGNLVVDTSATEPSGVSIFSDNLIIEGTVLVSGNLPFLSTVALEGAVPGSGNSAVAYECGNRNIGIASDLLPANMPSNTLGLGLAGGINRLCRL